MHGHPNVASYLTRWKELVALSKHQIYISHSHNPFLNLSIEHYLLQKSSPDSTVLFLYRNAPCIVIGRNQNPWLEVNFEEVQRLRRLGVAPGDTTAASALASERWKDISLVRRRSGGGAVVHDLDNVNFSVICPPKDFTRDKHSEIVTQAIREINPRARVNERHDIVLDQGNLLAEEDWPDPMDMHRSKFEPEGANGPPLKVSGSAYKLTRQRALHHGTCLLTCRELPRISQLLHSPARPFIQARGVESVRSPVGNISNDLTAGISVRQTFERELIKAFVIAHGIKSEAYSNLGSTRWTSESEELVTRYVGIELHRIQEIRKGASELRSNKWLYGQTPQFTLSSHPTEEDQSAKPRWRWPEGLPSSARVYLKAKSGTIISTRISISKYDQVAQVEADRIDKKLKDRNIHEVRDFWPILEEGYEAPELSRSSPGSRRGIESPGKYKKPWGMMGHTASWLNTMLGKNRRWGHSNYLR